MRYIDMDKDIFNVYLISDQRDLISGLRQLIINLQLKSSVLNFFTYSSVSNITDIGKQSPILLVDNDNFNHHKLDKQAYIINIGGLSMKEIHQKLMEAINQLKKNAINKAGKSFLKKFFIGLGVLLTTLILVYTYLPDYLPYIMMVLFGLVVGKQVFKAILALFNKQESKTAKKLGCL